MTTARDVHAKLGGKPHANGYLVPCVAHEDRNPSLSVSDGDDGRLLWNCKAGCSQEAVQSGLESRGFEVKGEREREPRDRAETVWTIRDASGTALAQHVRIDKPGGKVVFWLGPNGEKDYLKAKGLKLVDLPLYGTELLATTPADKPVCITEGEKAADAVRRLGMLGLGTVTGASTAPRPDVFLPLKGRKVYLWPDNDDPGRQHMVKIAGTLKSLGIPYEAIAWKAAPPAGDAADYRGTLEELLPQKPRLRALWEGTRAVLEELDRYSLGDFSDCTTTGLAKLDEKWYGGMRPGRMYLFGGGTGVGKTSFMQHVAYAAAKQDRGAVLFVSPEMSLESLNKREIVRRSGVSMWKRGPQVWDAKLREQAIAAHALAGSHIQHEKLPILILEELEVTMPVIEARAKDIGKLALVVIDYAQYVAGESARNTPRYLQVGEVAERSVELAMRLQVPVLVASQVNVAKDGNSRTYTFRESQILEHKAHAVLIFDVHWKQDENGNRAVERADLICTKNRDGSTFTLPVKYQPDIFQIDDETAQVYAPVRYDLTPPAMPR